MTNTTNTVKKCIPSYALGLGVFFIVLVVSSFSR